MSDILIGLCYVIVVNLKVNKNGILIKNILNYIVDVYIYLYIEWIGGIDNVSYMYCGWIINRFIYYYFFWYIFVV